MNTNDFEDPSRALTRKETRTARLLLVGVGLVSLAPVLIHLFLATFHIYDIRRGPGAAMPDFIAVRWVGQLSVLFPIVILCALVVSAFRPALTRDLLTLCTAYFLLFLVAFLSAATVAIVMTNVQAWPLE